MQQPPLCALGRRIIGHSWPKPLTVRQTPFVSGPVSKQKLGPPRLVIPPAPTALTRDQLTMQPTAVRWIPLALASAVLVAVVGCTNPVAPSNGCNLRTNLVHGKSNVLCAEMQDAGK